MDFYPITIQELIKWKNSENLSVEQVFDLVNRLFDPPLPRYKFADLTKNYFWINQNLDLCEACYLQYSTYKLEILEKAPENLQTEVSQPTKVRKTSGTSSTRNLDTNRPIMTSQNNLQLKKDFHLKTEPDTMTPRQKTAYSLGAGLRGLGSARYSDRPFSKTSQATLMLPTAAVMNHKMDQYLSVSKRRFF